MLEKWFEENSKISKHPTLVFSSSCISFFPLLFVSRLFIIIIFLIIITSNPSLSGIALGANSGFVVVLFSSPIPC